MFDRLYKFFNNLFRALRVVSVFLILFYSLFLLMDLCTFVFIDNFSFNEFLKHISLVLNFLFEYISNLQATNGSISLNKYLYMISEFLHTVDPAKYALIDLTKDADIDILDYIKKYSLCHQMPFFILGKIFAFSFIGTATYLIISLYKILCTILFFFDQMPHTLYLNWLDLLNYKFKDLTWFVVEFDHILELLDIVRLVDFFYVMYLNLINLFDYSKYLFFLLLKFLGKFILFTLGMIVWFLQKLAGVLFNITIFISVNITIGMWYLFNFFILYVHVSPLLCILYISVIALLCAAIDHFDRLIGINREKLEKERLRKIQYMEEIKKVEKDIQNIQNKNLAKLLYKATKKEAKALLNEEKYGKFMRK